MAEQSLKNKTVKGVGWSAIDQVVNQGITFIIGIVLARLLTPAEYGLIGIITIFITIFNVFITSGFNAALIRKKDATDDDFDTMFSFNFGVSVLMFVLLWFCAPLIANFFDRPELVSLTRVMGVVMIINAVAIVQTTILTKQIDFKKQTKISLISSVCSGIIGITLAFMGYGVWSLVFQQLSRQGLNTFLLWLWSKWRPRFKFYKQSFKEMWNFGSKLLASSILATAWTEMYQVVIGKFYNPASLGQYTRAQGYASLFSVQITNVVQRVTYPVLSEMQNDLEKLKQAYRRVIRVTMLPTFICMLGLAAVAKSAILVLIGEKWYPCIGFLQLVCLINMLYPLHAINLSLLQVSGRTDLFLRIEIYKKIVSIGPILLGIFVSIYAMLLGSIISGWVAYYLNAKYSGPYIQYGILSQIKDIMPSFFVAFAIAFPVYLLSFLQLSPFIMLPLQLAVGILLSFILLEKTKLPEYTELKEIVLNSLKRKK